MEPLYRTYHSDGELLAAAFDRYVSGGGIDQPSNTSGAVEVDGQWYVELHSAKGLLAVYRVDDRGELQPTAVDDERVAKVAAHVLGERG